MLIRSCSAGIRTLAGAAVALLAAAACTQATPESPTKPNFLFVAVDDLNAIVGFLSEQPGSPLQTLYPDAAKRAEVRARLTPNLDRLAESGRPFHRAYCPAPLCGPSRTAILTGVAAHRSGYHEHKFNFRECPSLADAVTLPQWLRQHGYFTAGIGKVFHHGKVDRQSDGTEADWTDRDRSWDAYPFRYEGGPTNDKDVWPKYNHAPTTYIRYGPTQVPFDRMGDTGNARFIAELLRSGKATIRTSDKQDATVQLPDDRPFFLACGLFSPHLPWAVPAEFFARFPTDEMAIDAATLARWHSDVTDLPSSGVGLTVLAKGNRNDLAPFLEHATKLDGPEAAVPLLRELNQAYLASVAFADACLGLIFQALDASPHAKDTIVVVWGDHGFHLGEKARLGKSALWEEANHTVLVLRVPGQPAPGAAVATPVSLLDLYATISDLAGVKPPPSVDGASLRPWIEAPGRATPPVLTTMGPGRHAVRDGRWCYIRYAANQEELYDDLADPEQRDNLAGRPEFAEEKRRLAALLPSSEAPLFERRK
ncbi:MAG: sulfatase [Planctomycetes bacterium]|nr:sulfatase [Planctomycetota bacterium]